MARGGKSDGTAGHIVSSAHLAEGGVVELSEFEYGLIVAGHAFDRWIVRVDGAIDEMSGTDTRHIHPGDVWVLETPGGGGYGKPRAKPT